MAAHLHHQDAITSVAAALSAEWARRPAYALGELLLTHRSSIGYAFLGDNFVVRPAASFRSKYRGRPRPYFLEVERRAITPKRASARLENYRRHFTSSWPERDHGAHTLSVLFVFETPADEGTILSAASTGLIPLFTSHLQILAERGVLGDVCCLLATHHRSRLALRRLHARTPFDHPSSSRLPVGGLPTKLVDRVFTLSNPKRRRRRPRVAQRRPRRRQSVPRTWPRPRVRSRSCVSRATRADT